MYIFRAQAISLSSEIENNLWMTNLVNGVDIFGFHITSQTVLLRHVKKNQLRHCLGEKRPFFCQIYFFIIIIIIMQTFQQQCIIWFNKYLATEKYIRRTCEDVAITFAADIEDSKNGTHCFDFFSLYFHCYGTNVKISLNFVKIFPIHPWKD